MNTNHTACTDFYTAKKLAASNLPFQVFEEPKTKIIFQLLQGLFLENPLFVHFPA